MRVTQVDANVAANRERMFTWFFESMDDTNGGKER